MKPCKQANYFSISNYSIMRYNIFVLRVQHGDRRSSKYIWVERLCFHLKDIMEVVFLTMTVMHSNKKINDVATIYNWACHGDVLKSFYLWLHVLRWSSKCMHNATHSKAFHSIHVYFYISHACAFICRMYASIWSVFVYRAGWLAATLTLKLIVLC